MSTEKVFLCCARMEASDEMTKQHASRNSNEGDTLTRKVAANVDQDQNCLDVRLPLGFQGATIPA